MPPRVFRKKMKKSKINNGTYPVTHTGRGCDKRGDLWIEGLDLFKNLNVAHRKHVCVP